MAFNIPAALRQLATTLDKLKELNEWTKLARQETKPGVPPSFRLNDHLTEDIRVQYSVFIATVMDIQDVLNNPALGIPAIHQTRWRRRLQELQKQIQELDLGHSFIKM